MVLSGLRWAITLAVAGVSLVGLALWERAQTCRQVASDVMICTYTAMNYVVAAVGGVLVVAAVALAVVLWNRKPDDR